MSEISITPGPAGAEPRRFDAVLDGEVAGVAEYHDADGVRTFTHTEVGDRFGGRGVGGALVRGALDATREAGLRVVPQCSFVAAYIDKHPEYQELLA